MSGEFKGFGEPARLYAKYKVVAERMRKAYSEDVDAFRKALEKQIQEHVLPRTLCSRSWERDDFHNYWLADNSSASIDDAVPVWFKLRLPEVIEPGELRVSVEVPRKLSALRQQVSSLRAELPLPPECIKDAEDPDSLDVFTVVLRYGKQDPVVYVAGPIAQLLKRIYDVTARKGGNPCAP